jgi:hypothetical protein
LGIVDENGPSTLNNPGHRVVWRCFASYCSARLSSTIGD